MKKAIAAGLFLAAFSTAAVAGAIADRQNIMKSFNGVGMTLRPMAQGTVPFDAAVAKTQLQIIIDGAAKLPSLFPAGSDVAAGEEAPRATAAVWTDTAAFLAAATKLGNDAKAAQAATDQASFATAWQTVQGNCNACHMTFRARPAGRGPGGPGGAPGGAPPAPAAQ